MKKGILGFFIGLLVLAVLFCIVVLIWGSVANLSFAEVIQSWFPAKEAVEETVARICLR